MKKKENAANAPVTQTKKETDSKAKPEKKETKKEVKKQPEEKKVDIKKEKPVEEKKEKVTEAKKEKVTEAKKEKQAELKKENPIEIKKEKDTPEIEEKNNTEEENKKEENEDIKKEEEPSDQKVDNEARKTFITGENKGEAGEYKSPYIIHDLLIPGGKPAKLARIPDPKLPDLRITELLFRLKFREPTPVILLVGGWGTKTSKVLAGVCRSAFHTDAVIVDSATSTGIEKFCIRKGVKLIGVAPEADILYPKVNPTERFNNELTSGHTHFVLIGDKTKESHWGDEAAIKIEIADKIAAGKYGNKPKCKVVCVLLGDNEKCLKELTLCNEKGWPIIAIDGSEMCGEIRNYKEKKEEYEFKNKRLQAIIDKGKFFPITANSEDVAQFVHLALCVTL